MKSKNLKIDPDVDDLELVSSVRNNQDSGALTILMDRHSGIFNQVLNKFTPPSLSSSERQDFFEEKPFIFFEAINSFREEDNVKFITWLANKTRFICLSKRSQEMKKPSFCLFDETYSKATSVTPEYIQTQKEEVLEILDLVEDEFGEGAKEIFIQRYFGGDKKKGLTFSEISESVGRSPQSIQNKHSEVLKFLRQKLSKS